MLLKAYKYRIYPTEEQKVFLAKSFGACRWIYNYALNKNINSYQSGGKHLNRFIIQKDLPILKVSIDTNWLSEINSQSLQSSLENLDKSFTNFFRKKKGFPKFKKKSNKQSFSIPENIKINIESSYIKIPKLKSPIKCVFSRTFEGKVKTCTISKTPTNKYYISILVETNEEIPNTKPISKNQAVGIDLGIKTFATLSTGETIENPKYLAKSLKKLKVLSRRYSKKKKGSVNKEKSRLKLALHHEKIANQRKDFLHKVSKKLVTENPTLCLETLSTKDMIEKGTTSLSRNLSDVGMGMFNTFLDYKASWHGCNIIRIGKYEPSTKTCSKCGNIQDMNLSERVYSCKKCKNIVDRDLNAAIVIKNIAFLKENTVGHTGI